MLDLTESPSAKLLESNIRLSIENAAADLGSSAKIVRLAHDLDETLDKLASQGDALLDRIVKYRARSLDGVLRKPFVKLIEGFFAGEDFEPGHRAFAAVGPFDRRVEDAPRGFPDVAAGAVTFDEGDNGAIGNAKFAARIFDGLAV